LPYPIDPIENTQSDQAEISDSELLPMGERSVSRKQWNPKNKGGKKGEDEKKHAIVVRFGNRLSCRKVALG
jgi:hypothetical protein